PSAAPVAAPALAAAPAAAPSDKPSGDKSLPSAARPISRAAGGIVSGDKLFDGSGDLVTRSGSVFAPSRAAIPALRGGVGFVRVKAAPVAPVKPVSGTQGVYGAELLRRVGLIAAKDQRQNTYHEASRYLFSTADNHTLNGTPGVADAYSGVFVP